MVGQNNKSCFAIPYQKTKPAACILNRPSQKRQDTPLPQKQKTFQYGSITSLARERVCVRERERERGGGNHLRCDTLGNEWEQQILLVLHSAFCVALFIVHGR